MELWYWKRPLYQLSQPSAVFNPLFRFYFSPDAMINLRENLIQIYFMVRLFLFRSSSCIIGSLVTFFSSSAIKTLQQQQQNNFNWKIFWQNLMKKLPPPKKLISSFSFKTGWSRRRNMFKNKMFNFLSKASKNAKFSKQIKICRTSKWKYSFGFV